MKDFKISFPRFLALSLVVLGMTGLSGCGIFFARPFYEWHEADWEFDDVGSFDAEIETQRGGVEIGIRPLDELEIFAVGGIQELEIEDSSIEPEGWFLGGGLRAPQPNEEGLHIDWGLRAIYSAVDEDDEIFDENQDEDFEILEGDANLGVGWAIPLGEEYFLTPQVGGFYKIIRGDRDVEIDELDEDFDAELDSFGGYAGIRLNSAEVPGVELMANAFRGTDDLFGFMVSLGFRF